MPTTSGGLRYPSGSDSPNVAQYIQNLATDVDNMINEAWSTYTPTWRAEGAGTQPTLGNGSLAGRYRRIDRYTGMVKILLTWGSTSSNGTATAANGYSFSLPSGWTGGAMASVVDGWFTSPTDSGPLLALINAGTTKIFPIQGAQNNVLIGPGINSGAGNYVLLHGIVELA